jgi:hypothetical protein
MYEVNVEALDVYFNLKLVSTQLINGEVPWRGGREKDFKSMQICIEASTTASVVFDAYASQVVILIITVNMFQGRYTIIFLNYIAFHSQVHLFMLANVVAAI